MTEGGMIGGKARGLHLLEECGCRVPPWSVVPSEVFGMHLDALAKGDEVRTLLEGLATTTPSETSEQLHALFQGAELSDAVIARIEAAYDEVGGTVAVRSSALQEDGAESSFAGVHATFLNVRNRDEVVPRVVDTWLSAFSPPALTYRLRRDVEPHQEAMAVVIQAMVDAAKSGVLFTANPMSGSRDEMVLSAVLGVGEGLVSGAVDADTVVLDKATGRVLSTYIGEKAEAHRPSVEGSGISVEPVAEDAREGLSLRDEEIAALCELGRHIEGHVEMPQDIEWAIDADGTIWMLQSRPLTALGAPGGRAASTDAELRVWDNSNILESFGAVTAPLTFSFARHAYYRAYREYARLMGVPRRRVDQMDEWLPNMLGHFDGRVYYNLLNWYKVIRLLPGYSLNRRILEFSMGLSGSLPDDVALAQVPYRVESPWRGRVLRGYTYGRFGVHFLTIERSVDRFLRYFSARLEEFEMTDLEEQDSLSVYRHFQQLEQDLLPKFGRMVILEAVVAMSYGGLQTLTKRWLPDAPSWFEFEVARPNGPIESTEPADRMTELAHQVVADPTLAAALDGPPETMAQRLDDAGHADFVQRVDAYIREFGHRSANELKLEEPDMRGDPAIFFQLLDDAVDASANPAPGGGSTSSADEVIREHLSGWRRVVYGVARSKVQGSLRARESVRFARSRAFGMTRRMMNSIGNDLRAVGAIDDERDIFYLELEELRAYMDGRGNAAELRDVIAIRRKLYDAAPVIGPARFETHGAPYWGQAALAASNGAGGDEDGLRGTPCVPGVVEGEVRVVDEPVGINGSILATYRTDPGWITVLPTVSGLLIERGSPLTHVAIAAREFGIPTIVQIPGLTERLQSGDTIRMDGADGRIAIIDPPGTDEEPATVSEAP